MMRGARKVGVLVVIATAVSSCDSGRVLYAAFHSGAPSRAERRRIDDRSRLMLRDLPHKRVVVAPVAVIGRSVSYDSAAARLLVERLNADSLALARVAPQPLQLPFQTSSNESAILWSRFKALSASVRASPISDADYVLLVDVFGTPSRGRVGAVHVMVVNANGDMTYRTAWNSHHTLFKETQPRSARDAIAMVIRALASADLGRL